MFFKKLVGIKDVEDALQRLDKLIEEEVRMAVAEILKIACDREGSWSFHLGIANHKGMTSLIGNELRKDLRKWVAPPDPSVNYNTACDYHLEGTAAWCTKSNTVANWKSSGSLLWIHGKRTYVITF